jgi:hypothetical protein
MIVGQESCLQGVDGGRPDEKTPLEKPRRRQQDNIKMNLQDLRWTGLMWLRKQVAGSCGCGNKTSCSTKCGEFLE